MKNVIIKQKQYKDYGIFTHIYCVDVNYDFNEKSVEDIVKFVKEEPFFDVLIHTNDISHDVIKVIEEISKIKTIWFKSDKMLFEDFATMQEESRKTIGFDKIEVMIDTLGDVIDVKKSLEEEKLVNFNYMELPF